MNRRGKKVVINFIFTILLELVTIISSFILPRLIIYNYGSDVNGLVTSISSFLGYLTLLQSGAGGVVRASLYKPLSTSNTNEISSIINASNSFFRKIGYFTFVYIIILVIFFCSSFVDKFDYLYISLLVIFIGLGTAAHYFFGLSSQILLNSDQKIYLNSIFQMILLLVNILISVILINNGYSIQFVKLISSILYVTKPILLNFYVIRKYKINKHITPNNKLISQRWDGFGHTIAYFVHTKIDVFALTIFSTLKNVSIFSVYSMITSGLTVIINSLSSAVQSAFGNMLAKKESVSLLRNFKLYVIINNTITNILFGVAVVLILPFIVLYTKDINDSSYINQTFSILIVLSEYFFCLRMPYHSIIISAGHYKNTKKGAYIEALINVIITIFLVKKFGLVGVTVGTLIAMIYRTIDYVIYLHNNIICLELRSFVKQIFVNILIFISFFVIYLLIPKFEINTYLKWCSYGVLYSVILLIINIIFAFIFYRDECQHLITMIKKVIFKNKNNLKGNK